MESKEKFDRFIDTAGRSGGRSIDTVGRVTPQTRAWWQRRRPRYDWLGPVDGVEADSLPPSQRVELG